MLYQDANGVELQVGDMVSSGDGEPGEIIRIEELDADYDDELGRGVMYGPYIYVKWPEYEELDRLTGYAEMSWSSYPDGASEFKFDDIEKVE